jgi:hypothetical protein
VTAAYDFRNQNQHKRAKNCKDPSLEKFKTQASQSQLLSTKSFQPIKLSFMAKLDRLQLFELCIAYASPLHFGGKGRARSIRKGTAICAKRGKIFVGKTAIGRGDILLAGLHVSGIQTDSNLNVITRDPTPEFRTHITFQRMVKKMASVILSERAHERTRAPKSISFGAGSGV